VLYLGCLGSGVFAFFMKRSKGTFVQYGSILIFIYAKISLSARTTTLKKFLLLFFLSFDCTRRQLFRVKIANFSSRFCSSIRWSSVSQFGRLEGEEGAYCLAYG
jgi:hypothetical protein